MLRRKSRPIFFRLRLQAAVRYSYNLLKEKDFTIKSGAWPEQRRAAGAAKMANCTSVQKLFSPQYLFSSPRRPGSPANKSLRGSRGPKAGVRGIPSPFINLDERGRDTPHPSLLPLLPRKDFLDEM